MSRRVACAIVVLGAGCWAPAWLAGEDPEVPVGEDVPPDVRRPDARDVTACDPVSQGGCFVGEKCSWTRDQDSPHIGHISCLPDGSRPLGGSCSWGPTGPQGFDDCVRGTYCDGGICRSLCDLEGDSCVGAAACAGAIDTTAFASDGLLSAGVCVGRCDPLTQHGEGGEACGSAQLTAPTMGCYGYDSFVCKSVAPGALTRTDRDVPVLMSSGSPFERGCAPGFIPLFFEQTGSTTTLCTGFCAALDTDHTPALRGNALGDALALAKLPASPAPAVGDATCTIGKKGSHASSRCRFLWPYVEDDQGQLSPEFANGPHLDTLGVCMAIEMFRYDADLDSIPETPFPDCADLPPRSAATPGPHDDAADWGCYRRSQSSAVAARHSGAFGDARGSVRVGVRAAAVVQRHRLR